MTRKRVTIAETSQVTQLPSRTHWDKSQWINAMNNELLSLSANQWEAMY